MFNMGLSTMVYWRTRSFYWLEQKDQVFDPVMGSSFLFSVIPIVNRLVCHKIGKIYTLIGFICLKPLLTQSDTTAPVTRRMIGSGWGQTTGQGKLSKSR